MQSQRSIGSRGGFRGTGRAGFRPGDQRRNLPSVPSTRQVVRGAAVSIVLKEDQATGREVQGVVQDVLTSGEHPRGIKVRLADGRVGRVQRMHESGSGVSTTVTDAPQGLQIRSERPLYANAPEPRPKYRDIRLDEQPEEPPSTYDLSAFIRTAKPKKKGGRMRVAPAVPVVPAATVSCPVCGDFEGDEAAVAHHVESHYG